MITEADGVLERSVKIFLKLVMQQWTSVTQRYSLVSLLLSDSKLNIFDIFFKLTFFTIEKIIDN